MISYLTIVTFRLIILTKTKCSLSQCNPRYVRLMVWGGNLTKLKKSLRTSNKLSWSAGEVSAEFFLPFHLLKISLSHFIIIIFYYYYYY
jgi:hypothetical protein